MSTRPPAAIVLDLDGTLLDWTHVARALNGIVAEPHRFTAIWHQKQLEYAWLATAAERFEVFTEITKRALRHTAAVHETEIPERLQRELVDAWSKLPPYPEVRDALARLGRQFALVALTNGTEEGGRRALEHAGLLRGFRHLLASEHARAYKPSPRIYDLPLPLLGVARQDVLYVTGNGWDAAGAQLFGYRVCRICRRGQEPDERLAARPELVVGSLGELADRLALPATANVRAA